MNILYVLADRGIRIFQDGKLTGASIHIREWVRAVTKLGHRVTIVTPSVNESAKPPRGVEVVTVKANHSLPPTSKDDGSKTAAQKERYSLEVSAAVQKKIRELARRRRFGLIYERYSLWSTAGVHAAEALGIPCIVEANSPLVEEEKEYRELVHLSRARAVEKEVFRGADLLLAVSDEMKAYALSRGADPEKTLVVENGVDAKRFESAKRVANVNGLKGKFVVGFAGSLKAWHGIEVLLAAFRMLQQHSGRYHLLLVGDGPLKSWIKGYIAGADMKKKVTLTGWVPHTKLPALIKRMDVAVAPYPLLKNFYFSPLKLFEYMAAARPIAASKIGQIEKVLEDAETGVLAKPGEAKDLAQKIDYLRRRPRLRKKIGLAAAREAKRHSWDEKARMIMRIAGGLARK